MFALKTLVIIALFLSVITIDLVNASKALDAFRLVVRATKRLMSTVHHKNR